MLLLLLLLLLLLPPSIAHYNILQSDETRICTTLQTFLQGALNWTSPLVSPHIHLLTFTDAQGRYKGTLIPPDLSDGTEDPCAGRGSEGTQNGLLCNKLKPADVLDTRRDKVNTRFQFRYNN